MGGGLGRGQDRLPRGIRAVARQHGAGGTGRRCRGLTGRTARACTAGAPQFTSYAGTGSNDPAYWPARGTYATTTTRCVDINVKLNSTRRVQTCFKKGKGWSCNGFRTLTGGRWGLAAKNVLDGTKFFLQFEGTARASGQLDY